VKLIDFGAATKVLEIRTMRRSTVGTPWYTAPEVINGEEYEYSADIWSLACTLIEFVTGAPPYSELNAVAALFKMAEHTPDIPPNLSPECHSFLDSCLQRVAKTVGNLSIHPFFLSSLVLFLPLLCCCILLPSSLLRSIFLFFQRPRAEELLETPLIQNHNANKEDNLLFLFNDPHTNVSALRK
jgi:serine/threonine protein kinase